MNKLIAKWIPSVLLVWGCLLGLTALAKPLPQEAVRISNLAHLALDEYREGVAGGRIVNAAEYEETLLFLENALRQIQGFGPPADQPLGALVRSLQAMALSKQDPRLMEPVIERLDGLLEEQAGVSLKEFPPAAPSLANGQQVYQQNCLACHGLAGRGDGPAAKGLNPAPPDFADPALLARRSPYGLYRTINLGVTGTAMTAWQETLTPQQRWDVLAYITRFPYAEVAAPPCPECLAAVPGLTLGEVATRNDPELASFLKQKLTRSDQDIQLLVAHLRTTSLPPPAHTGLVATLSPQAVLADVLSQLQAARQGFHSGQPAAEEVLQAYLTFEAIERSLATKDKALALELESQFNLLKGYFANGANRTRPEPEAAYQALVASLGQAESRLLKTETGAFWNALQSFIILMREGFEAMIIIAALIALTRKTEIKLLGSIYTGVGLGVLASALTAVMLETLFKLSAQYQEMLEGATILVAAGMLFYVSYWMLNKVPLQKWNAFIYGKLRGGLKEGSSWTLGVVSFLAVFREGFETILFYKALFISAPTQAGPILGGIAAGALGLLGLYLMIYKLSVRLPLKPFFLGSSILLYLLALVFVGKGLHELQEASMLSTTPIALFKFTWLGIYPTLETVIGQCLLVVAFLVVLTHVFIKASPVRHQV